MPKKKLVYVAVRDSRDLGLDKGTKCIVVSTYAVNGRPVMDLDVPRFDTLIAGVEVGHPDLKLVEDS